MAFNLPYHAADVREISFSPWTLEVVPAVGKVVRESPLCYIRKSAPPPQDTRYMIRGLSSNFAPKPFAPPQHAATRKGNTYIDSYAPSEGISLTGHILAKDLPSYHGVAEEYTRSLTEALWAKRREVWTKAATAPRSLSDVVSKCKYARLLTDVGAPTTPPLDELSSMGVELAIVNWGGALHKVYMTSKGSAAQSKHGERVAGATFHPQPVAAAEEDGVVTTKFFLVVDAPKGSERAHALIDRVPWREDGALFGTSPVRKDEKGAPMWRAIGPQDITPGSVYDVLVEDRTVTANPQDGQVSKRLTAVELYIKRAPARLSVRPLRTLGLAHGSAVLGESAAAAALEALAFDEMESTVMAAVLGGGSAPAAAAKSDEDDGDEEDPAALSGPLAGLKRGRSVGYSLDGSFGAGAAAAAPFSAVSTAAAEGECESETDVPPAGQK